MVQRRSNYYSLAKGAEESTVKAAKLEAHVGVKDTLTLRM